MRLGAWRFTPRLVPTLAAAVMLALLLSLGRWQVSRAHEKQERQALFETRLKAAPFKLAGPVDDGASLLYRRLEAAGRYQAGRQIYIDNRLHEGRAGFHVITPLQLDGTSSTVLVNRGWVARTAEYPRPPAVAVPEGPVTVTGLATVPPARVLELSADVVAGNVWQNLSLARYRERTQQDVLPFVLLASAPAPGAAPVVEQPDAGVAKHQEYALTWFSLAATVVALWLGLNLRRA
jgi:surfeit locus 1 family protein